MIGALVEAEHRLKLRLAAALETHAVRGAELHDFLHDVALLVDLDRIYGGVAALVAGFLDGVAELSGERLNPRAQDVGEAKQERQADALGMKVHGEVVEIQSALPIGIGVDGDVPVRVDPEVAEPPPTHVVELLGVLGGPAGRRRGDGSGYGGLQSRGEKAILNGSNSR